MMEIVQVGSVPQNQRHDAAMYPQEGLTDEDRIDAIYALIVHPYEGAPDSFCCIPEHCAAYGREKPMESAQMDR